MPLTNLSDAELSWTLATYCGIRLMASEGQFGDLNEAILGSELFYLPCESYGALNQAVSKANEDIKPAAPLRLPAQYCYVGLGSGVAECFEYSDPWWGEDVGRMGLLLWIDDALGFQVWAFLVNVSLMQETKGDLHVRY